jgi:SAM-dependent methyltransferase
MTAPEPASSSASAPSGLPGVAEATPPPKVPNPPCVLCGATDWRPHTAAIEDYLSHEFFDLERCGQCGLVVTTPAPPPSELGRYYPPRYRVDRQRQTGGWRTKRRAAMLTKHFPRGFRGRVLDVGCGTGAFAMEMQRRGWTVAVTELNDAVLDEMRTRGMEAKTPEAALREGFAGGKLDAITAWHVLEHVPNPLELATWVKGQLNANGVFQATVPNLESWQAVRYGRHWLHLDVPRHLFHFTPTTLRALLDKAGLKIVDTSTVALEYDVFGVVQSSLNTRCSKPNVLFERLTNKDAPPEAGGRDVSVSYLQLPVLTVLGLAHTVAAGAANKGGTLTATCRPR